MLSHHRRRVRVTTITALLVTSATALSAALPPALPPAATPHTIESCQYDSSRAAARTWQAKGSGMPTEHLELHQAHMLRFRCRFGRDPDERSYWDRDIKLDLSAARGLYFHFWSPDTAPVRQFNLYLRSGDGWYAGKWDAEPRAGWQSVHISKTEMSVEGTPRGWANIDGMRIAAWPGTGRDAEFCIANICRAGMSAPIVIVQGEAAAGDSVEEAAAAARACRTLARQLENIGINRYTLISDKALSAGNLDTARVVVLPHNPTLPATTQRVIQNFTRQGGRIIGFYVLPPSLEPMVGIQRGQYMAEPTRGHFAAIRSTGVLPGAPAEIRQASWNIYQARALPGRSRVAAWWYTAAGRNTGEPAILLSDNMLLMTHVLLSHDDREADLLLSMLGWAFPDAWEQAAHTRLQRIWNYRGHPTLDGALTALAATPHGTRASTSMTQARAAYQEARDCYEAGSFANAAVAAGRCEQYLAHAFAATQSSRPDEFRAVWSHRACGVPGVSWDESVGHLAKNGFTAVFPNIAWGGAAWYPSRYLPVAGDAGKQDRLAECLRACRRHNVQCHPWKICWNLKDRACRPFAARMARSGRTQVTFDGKADTQWLCPSHPENQALELQVIEEIVSRYEVDGIHLDYIRYPGSDHCFCAGCRERFEARIGRRVEHWPADLRRDRRLEVRWLNFRRSNIDTVVKGAHAIVRRQKRPVKLSAAVFTNANSDRKSIGQDWSAWCSEGLLDFICPMNYTPSAAIFSSMLAKQRTMTARVPSYPGIGLSTWPTAQRYTTFADQVIAARESGCKGFAVFEYDLHTMLNTLPLAGMGLTQ